MLTEFDHIWVRGVVGGNVSVAYFSCSFFSFHVTFYDFVDLCVRFLQSSDL